MEPDTPIFNEVTALRGRVLAPDAAGIIDRIAHGKPLPRCYCIANQKGGVGKTTLVLNMAFELAIRFRLRVVVIDTDTQLSTTDTLGVKPTPKGTYHLFDDDEADPLACVYQTNIPGVWVIPAHSDLKLLDAQLAFREGDGEAQNNSANERPWEILAQHVASLKASGRYDVIIIDTPGSLQLMTTNALYAADAVIAPFIAGPFELRGIAQLKEHVGLVDRLRRSGNQRGTGRPFEVSYAVMAAFDGRLLLDQQSLAAVKEAFPKAFVGPPIARRTQIGSAQSDYQSVLQWDPSSEAGVTTRQVVETILEREGILRAK
jgi:chromosome partitioning protein